MITFNEKRLTITKHNAAGTADVKVHAKIRFSGLDATLFSNGLVYFVKCELWEIKGTDLDDWFDRDDCILQLPPLAIIGRANITNNIAELEFHQTVSQEILRNSELGKCEFVGKFLIKNNTEAGGSFRYARAKTNQVDMTF